MQQSSDPSSIFRKLFALQPVYAAGAPGGGKEAKKKSAGKSIAAGGIAGGVEICITYPTEYVKTHMQLFEEKGSKKNAIQIGRETIKTHGVKGLYRGLASLLYFSIPKSAVRFWAFDQAKNTLQDNQGKMTTMKNLGAGLFAGCTEAIVVVTPMETIKVKFIHDQLSPNPKYRGFFHGVTTIAKQQGLAGCYKGLAPTIVKQGSNQMIRFGVFYEIKRRLLGNDPNKSFTAIQSMFAGAVAGAASVFGNTPVDVVKTRMQGLDSARYKGSWDCVKVIWREEGFRGFYKGTTPRLGRVCADVAIVMTLFEQITKLLDYVWED